MLVGTRPSVVGESKNWGSHHIRNDSKDDLPNVIPRVASLEKEKYVQVNITGDLKRLDTRAASPSGSLLMMKRAAKRG